MAIANIKTNCDDPMHFVNPSVIDQSSLKDIRDVNINAGLPKEERMLEFVSQISNPYCWRHGDYVVKNSFADTDITLEDRILSYLRMKYK